MWALSFGLFDESQGNEGPRTANDAGFPIAKLVKKF
jgi:hypothetical protein